MLSSWLCLHFFQPQKLRNELDWFSTPAMKHTSNLVQYRAFETYAMLCSPFVEMLALLIPTPAINQTYLSNLDRRQCDDDPVHFAMWARFVKCCRRSAHRDRSSALHPGMIQSGQEPGTYLHKDKAGYIFLQGHTRMHVVNITEMSTTRENWAFLRQSVVVGLNPRQKTSCCVQITTTSIHIHWTQTKIIDISYPCSLPWGLRKNTSTLATPWCKFWAPKRLSLFLYRTRPCACEPKFLMMRIGTAYTVADSLAVVKFFNRLLNLSTYTRRMYVSCLCIYLQIVHIPQQACVSINV